MGQEQLVGASPEMYVRIKEDRFETSPISGTVPVGNDPMETAERIKTLISSEKAPIFFTFISPMHDKKDV